MYSLSKIGGLHNFSVKYISDVCTYVIVPEFLVVGKCSFVFVCTHQQDVA